MKQSRTLAKPLIAYGIFGRLQGLTKVLRILANLAHLGNKATNESEFGTWGGLRLKDGRLDDIIMFLSSSTL